MIYRKGVGEPWFTLIKEGKKTSEGRLDKGDFSKFKEGDTVIWENKGREVKTKITKVVKYKTLYEMIKNERLKNVLPSGDIKTIQEGVDKIYRSPPVNYTREKEEKYGVLAIRVKVV